MENHVQILQEFLSCPINSADSVFQKLEELPGAIAGRGENPLQRYVCIPGSRENKIVLVAHADTVWDEAYGKPMDTELRYQDGIFSSGNPECGIGADDRAGCAMLWALRDCGHTLLVVNGEEKGKVGAKFLRESNPKLFRMLNKHRFMIELDWRGTGVCLYNQVANTKKFRTYMGKTLGVRGEDKKGGCDLQILCHRICGVNIGVGYHNYHTAREFLSVAEWENTLSSLEDFLRQEHPKFHTSLPKRLRSDLGRLKGKIFGAFKK